MAFTIIFKTSNRRTLRVPENFSPKTRKPVTAVIRRKTRVRKCLPSINQTNASATTITTATTTSKRQGETCQMYAFNVLFQRCYLILYTQYFNVKYRYNYTREFIRRSCLGIKKIK